MGGWGGGGGKAVQCRSNLRIVVRFRRYPIVRTTLTDTPEMCRFLFVKCTCKIQFHGIALSRSSWKCVSPARGRSLGSPPSLIWRRKRVESDSYGAVLLTFSCAGRKGHRAKKKRKMNIDGNILKRRVKHLYFLSQYSARAVREFSSLVLVRGRHVGLLHVLRKK